MAKHKKPFLTLFYRRKVIIFLKFQPQTLQTISKEIHFAVDYIIKPLRSVHSSRSCLVIDEPVLFAHLPLAPLVKFSNLRGQDLLTQVFVVIKNEQGSLGESLREFWTEIPLTLRCFTSKQRLLCCMWSTFLFTYRKRKSIYHPSSLIFDRRSFHYIYRWFHFFIIYLLWEEKFVPSSCLDASFKPGDLFKQSTVWTICFNQWQLSWESLQRCSRVAS